MPARFRSGIGVTAILSAGIDVPYDCQQLPSPPFFNFANLLFAFDNQPRRLTFRFPHHML
jgi:hypothetical protein